MNLNNERQDGTNADSDVQPSEQRQADISPNPVLAAVYVGEQTPLERLRNKLSPFLNLAAMLYNNDELVVPFVEDNKLGKRMNELFEKEIEQCQLNADDIHKHLSDCEVFFNRS